MFNKIKDKMGKKKNKPSKPQVQLKDNDGNISKKYIEDLQPESKHAIARLDEILKEKSVIEKRYNELTILENHYTGRVEIDVKGELPKNGAEAVAN